MEWVDVGGTSTNSIIPVLPQVGSGTRSRFLADIGSPTLGTCVKTAEENDPTCLDAPPPARTTRSSRCPVAA